MTHATRSQRRPLTLDEFLQVGEFLFLADHFFYLAGYFATFTCTTQELASFRTRRREPMAQLKVFLERYLIRACTEDAYFRRYDELTHAIYGVHTRLQPWLGEPLPSADPLKLFLSILYVTQRNPFVRFKKLLHRKATQASVNPTCSTTLPTRWDEPDPTGGVIYRTQDRLQQRVGTAMPMDQPLECLAFLLRAWQLRLQPPQRWTEG